MKNTKILVIGSGAIGGITAGLMSLKGYDVTLVTKYQESADIINSNGLKISGIKGDFTIHLPAVPDISMVNFTPDFVYHATKAYDMLPVAESLKSIIKVETRIISMQNGICEDALSEILGKDRVIGCVVGWGANYIDKGKLEMTSKGEFVIGKMDKPANNDLENVQDMLSAVLPVYISDNIRGNLYSKLIINSSITSLGVVTGLPLGKMLADTKTRSIFISVMNEAIQLANAMGLNVEPYAGKLDYYDFFKNTALSTRMKQHAIIRIIGFKYRRLYSSGLQSLERGRPTEIDFLNGYISENAKKYNIKTPINDSIIQIVKDIEKGKLKSNPQHIHTILRSIQ